MLVSVGDRFTSTMYNHNKSGMVIMKKRDDLLHDYIVFFDAVAYTPSYHENLLIGIYDGIIYVSNIILADGNGNVIICKTDRTPFIKSLVKELDK